MGQHAPLPVTPWAFHGASGLSHLEPLWAARKQELPRVTPRRQHAASLTLQGEREPEARKVDAGVGGEDLHIRKTVIVSHLTDVPWALLDVFWKLSSAGARSHTSELGSQVPGHLWEDFPHPPSSAKETCHQCRPGAQTLTPVWATLLSTALSLSLGSASSKGSAASPRPGPLCGKGGSAATKACRAATSLCDRETGKPEGLGGRHK